MATEGAPPFFAESIVFLAATVVAVPIAKRLGLGSVVGYLAAGAAIGPHGLALLGSGEDVLHVAELGVVLLLFVIGLELDPHKLWRMKRDIFGLGTAQVLLTGMTLFGIGRLAGYPFSTSLIAGFGLALSSTAFALQILQERGQLSSAYGQRAFGILLLQDIAIVPLLALIADPGAGRRTPPPFSQTGNEITIVQRRLWPRSWSWSWADYFLLNPVSSGSSQPDPRQRDLHGRPPCLLVARQCRADHGTGPACPWPWVPSWPACCWPNPVFGTRSRRTLNRSARC